MIPGFSFARTAGDDAGPRVGRFETPHGVVATPAFMPVATQGAVKGVTPDQVRETGAQILLSNTYHLHVRPGEERVAALGGLHRFTGWDGPILTDSGGFQVMSLAELCHIDDAGVTFRSHLDGAEVRLTPEKALQIQARLGTDIAMVLDHCPPGKVDRDEAVEALERTIRWAHASIEARDGLATASPMAVFAISQGGAHEDLRAESAERLRELPFDGFAVGGVSVGEDRDLLLATIPWAARGLPADRPRYLMGVAGFQEFVVAIESGIDLFDCVLPTRNARNGLLYLRTGEEIRLKNHAHATDPGPIDPDCDCATCARFSRGFLHHLIRRKELLGYTLTSIHNLRVFHWFLEEARAAIAAGEWGAFSARYRRVAG